MHFQKFYVVCALVFLAPGCKEVKGKNDTTNGASSTSSIDVTLPDKASLDPKLKDALEFYSLAFIPADSCAAKPDKVLKSDAYSNSITISARLARACDYSYSMILGKKDMVAKGESYYKGEGKILATDMAGKDKLSLSILLAATDAAKAIGLPGAVDASPKDIDVGVKVTLPDSASAKPPVAVNESYGYREAEVPGVCKTYEQMLSQSELLANLVALDPVINPVGKDAHFYWVKETAGYKVVSVIFNGSVRLVSEFKSSNADSKALVMCFIKNPDATSSSKYLGRVAHY